MENLECPHCHQRTIPAWRKQVMGPAVPATCPGCGGRVGVPFSSMWAVIPLLAGLVALNFVSTGIAVLLVALGAATTMWLYHRYVPLIPR